MKLNSILIVCIISISSFSQEYRIEKDLLGEKQIPKNELYGVQTARALENFQISDQKLNQYPNLIKGYAIVKMAAAMANTDVGKMDKEVLEKIKLAYNKLLEGEYNDAFQIDMYQGGAGTSTNMNINEVMANIALLESGDSIAAYDVVEPHDDLNMSQSTNDSYPSALKIAMILNNQNLIIELDSLILSFENIGAKYIDVVKMGRTELQDAVPMTVGQEFYSYARALKWERDQLIQAEKMLYGMNMGATAIGTGINTEPNYAKKCIKHLTKLTKKDIYLLNDLIAGTWDMQSFISYSSALKSLAIKLNKIASDLRLLASGPRTGMFEINLPALQPGSSIMPGKVNPVIPELVSLVCFRIIGNDLVVSLAAENGDLQLNAFEPIIGLSIFESQSLFENTMKTFRQKCIDGITINEDILNHYMERSVGIVTALNPIIGYNKATELAKEALETNKGILELIREKKILTDEEIEQLLDPSTLTGLNKKNYQR